MAAHRYWRIYVTSTASPGNYVTLAEVELRNSVGGSDLTGSGTASASVNSGTASNAVDNNTSTYWTSFANGPPQWWKYDFGSGNAYDIVQFGITPSSVRPTEEPQNFLFQYSDDDSAWTTAVQFVWIVWPGSAAKTFLVITGAVVTQEVVEVVVANAVTIVDLTASASDALSLSDEVTTSLDSALSGLPITISDSFALAEGNVKAQRKNAPNIPIVIADQFSDSFEIIGEFGLQLDTMRDQEFVWDIADVFNLTDAIYSSEYIEIAAGSDFAISDEIALGIALGVEAFDSFQDVWDPEAEIDIEIALAVPMEVSVEDVLSFTDEIAFIRESGRELEDRFTLVDSVRVRFEHYLEITGDLIALSDALDVGWNPSIEVADTLSLDDAGGVSTLIPSHIEIEVGVSETRLVVTEGLALFDGDFSTQGTEVFLGGTRLSYLRRYLNDVPR